MQTLKALCSEATLPSIFGIDQIVWQGSGGAIWECWKTAPCCGPGKIPSISDGAWCLCHWIFFGPCAWALMFSNSNNVGGCSIVPHCVLAWFCPFVTVPCLRYNLRKKSGTPGSLCGDFVCLYFLAPCACCQHLRAAPVQSWSLWPLPSPSLMGPMECLNSPGSGGGGGSAPNLATLL